MSPKARDIKEMINKWNYTKLKVSSMAKENISKMKRAPIVWENVLDNVQTRV